MDGLASPSSHPEGTNVPECDQACLCRLMATLGSSTVRTVVFMLAVGHGTRVNRYAQVSSYQYWDMVNRHAHTTIW